MPLYEYKCDACGHCFENIQKFSDALVKECPVCGGPVQKLQSAPAFQFRGSGWYVTDYAKKDQSKEAKAEGGSPAEAPSEKKETDKKETDKKEKQTKDTSEKAAKTDRPASPSASTESRKTSAPKNS